MRVAFTITGNVTDLDRDVPRHVGLAVTSMTALLDAGSVRFNGAKGRFDAEGNIVKDVPHGQPDEPWTIAVREGASLRLSTTSFVGAFTPIKFVAPPDGTVLSLADLVADNVPVPATPTGKYLRGEKGASAYDVAVAGGFVGTEEEWLASLVGPQALSLLPDPNLPGLYIMTGVPLTVDSDGLDDRSMTKWRPSSAHNRTPNVRLDLTKAADLSLRDDGQGRSAGVPLRGSSERR